MKIGVLGAGISGLSIARLLGQEFQVEVLESESGIGGIAKTRKANGSTYHPIGGHCFNSKYQEVLDFVFDDVLPKQEWHLVKRQASIRFMNERVSYPIEYAIKEINSFNPDLALKITTDFLSANDTGSYENLEDWFRQKFGDTLSDLYFVPYNTKIWNRRPAEMSHEWVKDKLPIPDKMSFFKGLISEMRDSMPHSFFYYPNSDDQNTFIDALAKNVNVTLSYGVERIRRSGSGWLVNGEKYFDILISTIPLKEIPFLLEEESSSQLREMANQLKFNPITTMFWRTKGTEDTWTYIPSSESLFHRYIHIGSFYKEPQPFSITEAVGEHSFEEMKTVGLKDAFLLEPLDYNVSKYAYVVFDENYQRLVHGLREAIEKDGFFLLGRFGEWDYFNMDICIKRCIDLAKTIKSFSK